MSLRLLHKSNVRCKSKPLIIKHLPTLIKAKKDNSKRHTHIIKYMHLGHHGHHLYKLIPLLYSEHYGLICMSALNVLYNHTMISHNSRPWQRNNAIKSAFPSKNLIFSLCCSRAYGKIKILRRRIRDYVQFRMAVASENDIIKT